VSASHPQTELRAPDGHAEAQRPPATSFVAAAVFIILALIGAVSLATDPYLSLGANGADPGPAFVPWITIYVLGIGGVAILVIELLKAKRSGGIAYTGEFTISRLWMPVTLVVMMMGYVELIQIFGFFWLSVGFSLICVSALHWRTSDPFTPRYLIQLPVEALLVTGVIYAIFRYGILVPLP
jgi:hypothetical protein